MQARASIYVRDTEAEEEACEDGGGDQVIWSQPGHIWVPWSQKGRKDPFWSPRGERSPTTTARSEAGPPSCERRGSVCSDLSGRHPDASMRVWLQLGLPVSSAALLRTSRPGDRTASPPRAETETQAWQMRPGV